jgi:hypothetical protein
MKIESCVRFTRGAIPRPSLRKDPNPGSDIAAHLVQELPRHDILVEQSTDIEFAHELLCQVDGRQYTLLVSYDWITEKWWEIFYSPTLSWFQRLLGQSETGQMTRLSLAIQEAINTLPGVIERRWYKDYGVSAEGPHTNYLQRNG